MPAPQGNQYANGNPGGGRNSLFDERFIRQAYQLCLLGATDAQIADFFGVCETTINTWKTQHQEFSEALKRGKFIADANVAESLYRKACGYSHEDTENKVVNGEIVKVPITKHYPPDTTACIFWLKNRQRKIWRDKQEVEHSALSDQPLVFRFATPEERGMFNEPGKTGQTDRQAAQILDAGGDGHSY